MRTLRTLVEVFWPIAMGFGALFILARYSDSIARRVAPEMLARASEPQRPSLPTTVLGWLRFIVLRVGAVAAVLVYIAGPIALQFATVAFIAVYFAYDAYKRTRPLVAKGVTPNETIVLVLLCAVWVFSWTYFLFRFTYGRYVAG